MRVYVIHVSSRYPSLKHWTHCSVACKMGDINGLSLSASRTDSLARSSCPRDSSSQCILSLEEGRRKGFSLSASRTDLIAQSTCPRDSSSQCFPSCGAPAHPLRGTCTTSYKVNCWGRSCPLRPKCPGQQGPQLC